MGSGLGDGVLRTRVLAEKPQVLLPPHLASAFFLHCRQDGGELGPACRWLRKSPHRWQVEKVPRQSREDRDRC